MPYISRARHCLPKPKTQAKSVQQLAACSLQLATWSSASASIHPLHFSSWHLASTLFCSSSPQKAIMSNIVPHDLSPGACDSSQLPFHWRPCPANTIRSSHHLTPPSSCRPPPPSGCPVLNRLACVSRRTPGACVGSCISVGLITFVDACDCSRQRPRLSALPRWTF